uniref:Putative DNA-binding protein n=1 Tax=Nonomuraea gerenzanensis TaxID=93944 RepID=A0A1M4EDI1_9ACTN|nr:putative DNA-binding protein [Nonomuraea gerenzanensis]
MSGQQRRLGPRAELSEFLRTRRARLRPCDVGLAEHGRRRRVPGLRREELARLAGVSMAYYTRLEQGNVRNVSVEVLDAISRALRLSDAEHAHLLHLARPGRRRPEPQHRQVRPALLELLAAMEGVPAYVWGRRTDVLAWNAAASALFGDWAARAPGGSQLGQGHLSRSGGAAAVRRLGVQGVRRGGQPAARRRVASGRPAAGGAGRGAVGAQRGLPRAVGGASRQTQVARHRPARASAGGGAGAALRELLAARR